MVFSHTYLNVKNTYGSNSWTYVRQSNHVSSQTPKGLWARGIVGTHGDFKTFGTITSTDTDGGISLKLGFASTVTNSSTSSLTGNSSVASATDFTQLLKVSNPNEVLLPAEVDAQSDMVNVWSSDTAYKESWIAENAKPAIKQWSTESYNNTGITSITINSVASSDGTGWVSTTDSDHSNTTYFLGTTTYAGTGTRSVNLWQDFTSSYTYTEPLYASQQVTRVSKYSTTQPTVHKSTIVYEDETLTHMDTRNGTFTKYHQKMIFTSTYTTSTYQIFTTNTYTTSANGAKTGTTTQSYTAITAKVAQTTYAERVESNEVQAYGHNLGNVVLTNEITASATSSQIYGKGKKSETKTLTASKYNSDITLNLNAPQTEGVKIFTSTKAVFIPDKLTESRYTNGATTHGG